MNTFGHVYAHAIEYQLKLQHCTRLLLDTFAHSLVTSLSHEYGFDQEKVMRDHATALVDSFVADPATQLPMCKAVTYRGKACHKRACSSNEGYCDVHWKTSRKRIHDDMGTKNTEDEFSHVSKLLRTF